MDFSLLTKQKLILFFETHQNIKEMTQQDLAQQLNHFLFQQTNQQSHYEDQENINNIVGSLYLKIQSSKQGEIDVQNIINSLLNENICQKNYVPLINFKKAQQSHDINQFQVETKQHQEIQNNQYQLRDQKKMNNIEEKKIKDSTRRDSKKNIQVVQNNMKIDWNQKINLRLLHLFQFYAKKEYHENKAKTFQQIKQKVKSMDLNMWMRFNKDFNVLKFIGKDQIHNIFKKFSKNRNFQFDQFKAAIQNILQNKQKSVDLWKSLGIASENQFHLKLKQFGVPFIQNQNIKKSNYALPILKKNQLCSNKQSKVTIGNTKQNNSAFDNLDIQKLSNLKMKFNIPIQAQEDDRIYLKEYNIDDSKQSQNKRDFKYVSPSSLQRQASEGILGRIDQRMKKYLRH